MTQRTITRQSIQSTYDSRETGPRYNVTTTVDDQVIGKFMQPIDDPFVRQTVNIHWRDVLRAALRRRGIKVEVTVGGDADIVNDVLELDDNTLVAGSSRRAEFDAGIGKALVRHAKGEEAAETEQPGWSS